MVDLVFWEMCNPKQEFTRINSLAMLFRLHDTYKTKIIDGYLTMPIKEGFSILNPDSNLKNSQNRLLPFFEKSLPLFKRICDERPTRPEIEKHIQNVDVLVYAGHGSGLHHVFECNLTEFKMHCVTFLIGCESVALKSDNNHSEKIGAHLFYHFSSWY